MNNGVQAAEKTFQSFSIGPGSGLTSGLGGFPDREERRSSEMDTGTGLVVAVVCFGAVLIMWRVLPPKEGPRGAKNEGDQT